MRKKKTNKVVYIDDRYTWRSLLLSIVVCVCVFMAGHAWGYEKMTHAGVFALLTACSMWKLYYYRKFVFHDDDE